ncbi:type I DNA topoisomerase [Sinanaerobacter chloroacetimidivorans]|jgi:DNA topoisomerase-1|uniref:DNA topoisomerase 1 n=1 Tax=Sinanaerobacter chloroacetimidivorans TaxID=2818044 RepID=A0A8J7W6I3_9FIRM|nr:type I DNA topoisomerase [Sinanaerobacter chloroacetimidivorans]MBR0600238.1 type I DNA topoisomerase [Sinanaerobacter chloroacetimidivorans]
MADKNLVIVESPSKAKTIGKFLGSKYKVVASVGHIRDLPKSKLGINIENNFEPEYISIRGKGDIIKAMKKEAKDAGKVYLATDPDREGEAISWHIAYLLGIDEKEPCRIVFNEITKGAIQNAVKKPRAIDKKLVDAQQARRVLDRLVGYKISPLLWRKIRRGLSAGRVQSAALKIICDREKIILEFEPKEYWNISAVLTDDNKTKEKKKHFTAKLIEHKGKKITISNKEEADKILAALDQNGFMVKRVEEKERTKKPNAPFTTSSLQQEASNKLNFYTKKTMLVAQQLYEGIEIKGHGIVGLVTYIRTDSVRVSDEAQTAVTEYIKENFSDAYLGNNSFSNKKKDVQDAHEAIRPSIVTLHPDEIKDSLTKDQYMLYRLIWSRFVASRMSPAVYDSVSADIVNSDYLFRATGSKLKFDGYLKIYNNTSEEDEEKMLPQLTENDRLKLVDILSEQNFTQPPSRFSEAALVKDLEDKNIGRPSTYAPIIATLIERKYITREKKMLKPTELGFIVTDLMETYFHEIVDAGFTAALEDKLDDVEVKNIDWKDIIHDFYGVLEKELEVADSAIEKVTIEDELTDEICEVCGKQMAIKHGRFGEFLACSGYPDCKNTKPIISKIDVKCPNCGKDIVARKSKKGRVFYGCSGFPECNQLYWNKPVDKKCPNCNSLLMEKKTKTTSYLCSNAECGYKE